MYGGVCVCVVDVDEFFLLCEVWVYYWLYDFGCGDGVYGDLGCVFCEYCVDWLDGVCGGGDGGDGLGVVFCGCWDGVGVVGD